jgi:hypothetical protein
MKLLKKWDYFWCNNGVVSGYYSNMYAIDLRLFIPGG